MVNVPTRCTRCKKRLNKQVIRALKMQFHPKCFICDKCRKPLEKSFQNEGQKLYHPNCFKSVTGLICKHCKKILADSWVEVGKNKYHPECREKFYQLKCAHCGKPIKESYQKDEKGRYHQKCYQELHKLYCKICRNPIKGDYYVDIWGNKAHKKHKEGPTVQCHSCTRLMGQKGHKLSDGRSLCKLCKQTEMKDPQIILKAKFNVIEQMQAVGFDYIPDYITVSLAHDQNLLNERLRASPTGNIHGFTRTATKTIPGYGQVLEHTIHMINGLPEITFKAILAHELLHVWINEKKLNHLTPPEVEGFCNLGSELIYTNEGSPLAKIMLKRMLKDPDKVYGDGYRMMTEELKKLGWPKLIKKIQTPF